MRITLRCLIVYVDVEIWILMFLREKWIANIPQYSQTIAPM